MSVLAVNGVALPVGIDKLKVSFELVGAARRNQRGHAVVERRRDKWVVGFETSPMSLDEAMMAKSLVLGEGEFWNTLTSVYGAKGMGLTGTGAWTGSGGGNPINTNGVFRATTGQTLIVPGKFYDQSAVHATAPAALTGATLVGWRYDETLANYRLFAISWRALDAAVVSKREKIGPLGASGAVQNYTGAETFSVAGGNLTITEPGTGGGWRYSNLRVLPWFLPVALVDALLEGMALTTYTLPRLPNVYVTSDLLPTDQLKATPGLVQSSLVCNGALDGGLQVTPLARDGAFQLTDCTLAGTLTEV